MLGEITVIIGPFVPFSDLSPPVSVCFLHQCPSYLQEQPHLQCTAVLNSRGYTDVGNSNGKHPL